jgi:hypothetical protein
MFLIFFRISAWVSAHGDVFASLLCERWQHSSWCSCYFGIVSVVKRARSSRVACPRSSLKSYTISLTGIYDVRIQGRARWIYKMNRIKLRWHDFIQTSGNPRSSLFAIVDVRLNHKSVHEIDGILLSRLMSSWILVSEDIIFNLGSRCS